MSFFKSDSSAFSYMGRIDFSRKDAPVIIYAGSNISCKFKGTYLNVCVENLSMGVYSSLGVIIDGIQYKTELSNESGAVSYKIAEGLSDEIHTLTVFKRQAAAHYFRFLGIETDGEIIAEDKKHGLKLEFYGDSVSAGEVTEAVYYEAHQDPENHNGIYDNSYFSYTWLAARRLNAEFYNNSQGGLSLFDKTGYFYSDSLTGLETTYNKLSYVPYAQMGLTDWDFSRYTPDVVVIAIGQNDAAPDPKAIYNHEYKEKWKNKYKEIMSDLDKKYGGVKFVLITTVLMHDHVWDDVLDEIKNEYGGSAYRLRFSRNGAATPGHPRITEQNEMAIELAEFIKEKVLATPHN